MRWRAVAWGVLGILNLSLLVALANHAIWWPERPLFTDKGKTESGQAVRDYPIVELSDMLKALQHHDALFIDARPAPLFREGHIPSAISMPAEAGLPPRLRETVISAPRVIVYCEGNNCDASRRLAAELEQHGVTNLAVFPGGWATWLEAGLPTMTVKDN
jgi:3-mercaptopyruvate sulfurtransferase SseA